jgi:hypothetical protein
MIGKEDKDEEKDIYMSDEEGNNENCNFRMDNNDSDPHWSITLSRLHFPWEAVRFGEFSANECF